MAMGNSHVYPYIISYYASIEMILSMTYGFGCWVDAPKIGDEIHIFIQLGAIIISPTCWDLCPGPGALASSTVLTEVGDLG